jgi:hypothetical protein
MHVIPSNSPGCPILFTPMYKSNICLNTPICFVVLSNFSSPSPSYSLYFFVTILNNTIFSFDRYCSGYVSTTIVGSMLIFVIAAEIKSVNPIVIYIVSVSRYNARINPIKYKYVMAVFVKDYKCTIYFRFTPEVLIPQKSGLLFSVLSIHGRRVVSIKLVSHVVY